MHRKSTPQRKQELVDGEELVAAIQKACSSKDAAMARRVAAALDENTKAAVFDVAAAVPSKDRSQLSPPTLDESLQNDVLAFLVSSRPWHLTSLVLSARAEFES